MTGHKDWLTDLDASKKTQIKLADNRALTAEGMGNIVIRKGWESCMDRKCTVCTRNEMQLDECWPTDRKGILSHHEA